MMQGKVNPYQPVEVVSEPLALDGISEARAHLTRSQWKDAEAQYLLHWHPIRLIVGSLLMIAGSVLVIHWALRFPLIGVALAVLISMAISAVIYLSLVHHSKQQLRSRLRQFGLIDGAEFTVRSEPEQLILNSATGTYLWPNNRLKMYWAKSGILLCPEPLLFVYLPKVSDFQHEDYKTFAKRMAARTRG